jgi:hypothetical protein
MAGYEVKEQPGGIVVIRRDGAVIASGPMTKEQAAEIIGKDKESN